MNVTILPLFQNVYLIVHFKERFTFVFLGATRDDFCFFLNGTRADVESNIRGIPVNAEFDPRFSDEQSTKQDKWHDESSTLNLIPVIDT